MTEIDWTYAIKNYGSRLERLLLSLLGRIDDARDAAQETWASLWKAVPGRLTAADPWPLIRRTAVRKAIDRLRSQKRTVALVDEPPERATTEDFDDVAEALLGLEFEERAALVLYFWEGLSVREIAATLDCPEGTIKVRMFRGRQKLRESLERLGGR